MNNTSVKAIASLFVAFLAVWTVSMALDPESDGNRVSRLIVASSVWLSSLTLDVLALRDIRWSQGRLRGRGFAVAALWVSSLAVAGYSFLFALDQLRGGSVSIESANKLKQLVLAMDDYARTNGSLPPAAVYDKKGRGLLSWRVSLLLYLGEENLYKQFRLDEPWDGPHNRPLLQRMPEVYAPPHRISTPEPYVTYYQVFVGKGTAFEEPGVSLADFPDGWKDTILIVEAGDPVPWTKPEELPYAADQPLPKLGMVPACHFRAGFADGCVHSIRRSANEHDVRALITRNGGDKPGPNWEWSGSGSDDP